MSVPTSIDRIADLLTVLSELPDPDVARAANRVNRIHAGFSLAQIEECELALVNLEGKLVEQSQPEYWETRVASPLDIHPQPNPSDMVAMRNQQLVQIEAAKSTLSTARTLY